MEAKNREWFLALAAGVCVFAFIGDRLVLSPVLEIWSTRSQRIAEVEERLKSGKVLVRRETAIRDRWREMEDRAFTSEVSEAEDRILKSADRWAQESGLGLSSLKPRVTQEDEGFREAEFSASGQGDIESISRFLYELERDPLALKLEEVQIGVRDKSGQDLAIEVRFSGLLLTGESL